MLNLSGLLGTRLGEGPARLLGLPAVRGRPGHHRRRHQLAHPRELRILHTIDTRFRLASNIRIFEKYSR